MKKLYTTIAFALLSGIIFAQMRIYTPALTAPEDNATGLSPASILDWNAVTGNSFDITYQLMLDQSPDFNNPMVINTTTTSYQTSNLYFNSWYYWKVRAWDESDTSAWSPVRSFKVLNSVVLDKPLNNAVNRAPNEIVSWDSIPGVTKYQIQYDTTYYLTEVSNPFNEVLTDVCAVNENLAWLVGEAGTVGKYENETWTEVDLGTNEDLFDVDFLNNTTGAIGGGNGLVYLYNGTDWESLPITGVTANVIAVSVVDNGTYAATENANVYYYDGNEWTNHGTLSGVLLDVEFLDENTGWAVGENGAIFHYNGIEWIDESINDADDLFSISILSENNAWTAGGHGEFYHYDGTQWNMVESTNEDDVFSIVMLDENTGYAIGESFFMFDGNRWNDNTNGVDADINSISISDNGTGWAVGEDGFVLDFGSNAFSSPLAEIRTISTIVPEHELKLLPFGADIFWRIRALNAVDTSGWSAIGNFTTFNQITLSKPDNGSEQELLVKLKWGEKTGINGYEIQVSKNENFNDPDYYFIDSVSIYLDELRFGETYYWRGRAVHNQDTSAWSQVWNFHTTDQVLLSSPSDGVTNASILPSLRWDMIENVPRYQVQLSNTPSFDSIYHDDIAKDTNASQVITKLDYNTTYYWRVRGIIIAPDTSGWSDVWEFTTFEPQGIADQNGFDQMVDIYPNPASNLMTLQYSGEQAQVQVQIVNLIGKVVLEEKVDFTAIHNRQSIDLQNLTEGVYLIRLHKNGESTTKKLVIER